MLTSEVSNPRLTNAEGEYPSQLRLLTCISLSIYNIHTFLLKVQLFLFLLPCVKASYIEM